jgi:hypothetical protein
MGIPDCGGESGFGLHDSAEDLDCGGIGFTDHARVVDEERRPAGLFQQEGGIRFHAMRSSGENTQLAVILNDNLLETLADELRQKFCYPGWGVKVGEMIRCARTNCYRGWNGQHHESDDTERGS